MSRAPADVGSAAPEQYGYAAAIHDLGSVAAPLLAGFSLTLTGYLLTQTGAFRWPNLTLALLLAAGLCLIACVQCTVCARLFVATPAQLERNRPAGASSDAGWLAREEARLVREHRIWARRTAALYNGGVVFLLAGVTVALVPPAPLSQAGTGRLAAVAVGLMGLVVAGAWIGAPRLPARWVADRLPRRPEDAA